MFLLNKDKTYINDVVDATYDVADAQWRQAYRHRGSNPNEVRPVRVMQDKYRQNRPDHRSQRNRVKEG